MALDGDRRLQAGRRLLEDREHLIGSRFDLAARRRTDRRPKQASNVGEKCVVPVAQTPHQPGGVLDIGEEKGHEAGGQRPGIAGASLDLAVHPGVFNRERHRRRHRPGQVWILESDPIVDQRGHRTALTAEQRDRAILCVLGERGGLAVAVQVGRHRVRPVQDRQCRVTKHGAQAVLQLVRRPQTAELDDRLPGCHLPALRLQLAGHEADRYDAVLLRRSEQPGAGPIARHFVFETDLVEASKRVADVGLVVDRQPAGATRIDIREGAIR